VFDAIDLPASRHGRDDAGLGIHAADTVVVGVGDEEVAGAIESDVPHLTKLSIQRRAAIAREPRV
jgi:hypothetical protein